MKEGIIFTWWNTCNPVACNNQNLVYTVLLIITAIFVIGLFSKYFKSGKELPKKEWKYKECNQCYILYPHLAVPEICICGNNMKKNSNKKNLKLIEFNEVRVPSGESNNVTKR